MMKVTPQISVDVSQIQPFKVDVVITFDNPDYEAFVKGFMDKINVGIIALIGPGIFDGWKKPEKRKVKVEVDEYKNDYDVFVPIRKLLQDPDPDDRQPEIRSARFALETHAEQFAAAVPSVLEEFFTEFRTEFDKLASSKYYKPSDAKEA